MTQPEATTPHRQPWLHQLSICVNGNATALSAPDGDLEPGTVHGLYVDDRRVLSALLVRVAGERPAPVADAASGDHAEFLASARSLGNAGPDPTVEVRRVRVLDDTLTETVTISSRADGLVRGAVELTLASDGLDIAAVKSGHLDAPAITPLLSDATATFADEFHTTTVQFTPRPDRLHDTDGRVTAVFDLEVPPGGSAAVTMRVTAVRARASQLDADPGAAGVDWSDVRVRATDQRLPRVLECGLDDVRHLLLRDPLDPADVFAAAGTPWYLTLFGRDSIWAARMLLPFGTDLADGTLRALARRQGTRHDPLNGEQPGKIPHELRREAFVDGESGLALPPVYYGTVDATALWVTLLAEAWEWGLAPAKVEELLPALERAVAWLTGPARPDADGLLKYLDPTGTGLANQGWKDSGDSVRWRDGRLADAPIALVEAQAYTVEALRQAARLYRAFGREGADAAESSAADLAERLREAFWVETDAGRHLAIALDADGKAVDGLASNMGHVLGTGVLTPEEARAVAATVTGPELLDRFGVRTLGSGNGGFNPIGYHTGSIWTHDTAVTAWGLAREGLATEAATVARTLLASAEAFSYRWPELYSGLPMMGAPTPYPASCRPQAWSAASAVVLVSAALGLRADVPGGVLHLGPAAEPAFGAMCVEGLRWAGQPFSVTLDADGRARADGLPRGVEVRHATQVADPTQAGRSPAPGTT